MIVPAGSEIHRRFCANIRRRRLELGLTQVEMAERMGISQPAYAQIEAARRGPGIDVIAAVAKALECEPSELLAAESKAVHHAKK